MINVSLTQAPLLHQSLQYSLCSFALLTYIIISITSMTIRSIVNWLITTAPPPPPPPTTTTAFSTLSYFQLNNLR